jgi:glutathione peroxidase-family protein
VQWALRTAHSRRVSHPCTTCVASIRVCNQDLCRLVDTFASLPGQPFSILLLPCDQFTGGARAAGRRLSNLARLRRTSSDHSFQATQTAGAGNALFDRTDSQYLDERTRSGSASAGHTRPACSQPRHLVQHATEHGMDPHTVRVLAKGDCNGPNSHPMWTWLKVASGDTSDTGDNFGKFLVARDGRGCGRFCAPLRPALLEPAIVRLLTEMTTDGITPIRSLRPNVPSLTDLQAAGATDGTDGTTERSRFQGPPTRRVDRPVFVEPASPKACAL